MQIVHSLFPKFFGHLDVRGLAAAVRAAGLDTADLVIRKGYWVTGEDLAREVPAFVKALAAEGLKVHFATAGFAAAEVVADPAKVKVLADSGLTDFRLGYFGRFGKDEPDLRAALGHAREDLERLAAVLEKIGIRAVYQVHHGTLVPGPSGIYHLMKGLPSRVLGVMLDPGNQAFEGYEDWDRSARLLGDYLAAVGVKDTAVSRDPARAGEPDKGWKRDWAPCDEGVTNWAKLARALKAADFGGTFNWQPFYNEKEPEVLQRKLKREVAYIRNILASAGGAT